MSGIHLTKDDAKFLAWLIIRRNAFNVEIGKILDRAARAKDLPSRNKPLAPGKPSKRGAKGKPAKAGVKARKGSGKK